MVEFTTPVGRIVWGHPTKSKGKTRKDPVSQQFVPVIKDGVQVQQWTFGVAFTKADFQTHIWPYLAQEAQSVYQGAQVPPKFAWKYKDGDSVDDDGKPYADREGYAGCFVLTVSTELMQPALYKFNGTSYDQLPGDAVKTGDYVVLGLNAKANIPADRTMTPGLYINPTVVEFVGFGTEIVSVGAVNPMTALGGRVHQLPPGASATPIGGGSAAGIGMPGMAPTPQPGQMAAPAPMGAPAPMAAPGGMPQPGQMPGMAQPAPMAAPQPVPTPMAAPAPMAAPQPQRPTDPSHIAPNPQTGAEMWWNGQAWTPAPVMPAPAADFVANAGMPAPAPMAQPGMMPGMMAPR